MGGVQLNPEDVDELSSQYAQGSVIHASGELNGIELDGDDQHQREFGDHGKNSTGSAYFKHCHYNPTNVKNCTTYLFDQVGHVDQMVQWFARLHRGHHGQPFPRQMTLSMKMISNRFANGWRKRLETY